MKLLTSLIWAVSICHCVYSQKPKITFQHLDKRLSQSTVNCFLQDSKGYLWIGTMNGLNRYNGADVEIYKNHPDDSTSLSYNPMQKELIAYHNKSGKPGEYDKSASQQSYEIALVEGQKYYIEALMKENKGKDHLSVSWLMPDGTKEAPISGIHLSPANNPGADVPVKYEAELANLSDVQVNTVLQDFSGTGYVELFTESNHKVVFTVENAKAGTHNLTVGYAAAGGDNTKEVLVNGIAIGIFNFYASSAFTEINLGNIDLNEGQNTIEIAQTSGDLQLDYILVGGSYPNIRKASLVLPESVEPATESEISMYPNPVKSTLTLLLKNEWNGKVGIRVLNLVGQEVKIFEMEKSQKASRYQLDLKGLQNGIYIVELNMGENRIINRVIVQQ
ncbi:CBM35 domain-containing protein [Flexithrix dorotheae]|uniref:CBM35 domain-containing protein n=1 Tax=Flexithrix dorotheae TaxID=70993 RepID=UPI000368F433|nr:CBM35 domain-containing protein [Flexithrix dorotheae]